MSKSPLWKCCGGSIRAPDDIRHDRGLGPRDQGAGRQSGAVKRLSGGGVFWAFWAEVGVGVGGEGCGLALFITGCVLGDEVFGTLTASRRILFAQAVPTTLGLIAVPAGAEGVNGRGRPSRFWCGMGPWPIPSGQSIIGRSWSMDFFASP